MAAINFRARRFSPSPRNYVALLANFQSVGNGKAPQSAERAYTWLQQQPSYKRAVERFRRKARTSRTSSELPPTFDDNGERRLLLHVAWLLVENHFDIDSRMPPKMDATTALRRAGVMRRLVKLQADFAAGVRLTDSAAQASLENGVRDLLLELTRARHRYSGARVQGKDALLRFAGEMHDEFAWCGPEFLADIASLIGVHHDRRTFARISKAKRKPWSYLKP